ncbi:MAG: (d)CMP kinase [Alphaproteobacteria bacterium]|jgi:CMP/dCMP kinase|nr:(d)CMP kinase [Alphaproteobacteria bacterium]MDP4925877.1 (d)CMP kinase [Alphaproteobacteria bacterium]
MIIAIDGSAASGKGTLAKRVAAEFGYDYLDTGALYRAVALSLLNAGAKISNIDEKQAVTATLTLDLSLTQAAEIRTDKVAALASIVAAINPVRAELLALQRAFAAAPPSGKGAVLDGRDIGTIVLPNADIKFFIDADLDIRAERRTKELLQAGQSVMFRDVLEDMKARDDRDRTRPVAPLKAADDAITIDTSKTDATAVLALALSYIDRVGPSE